MMQKFAFFFLFLFVASLYSQSYFTISGTVLNDKKAPVDIGDVLLFNRQNDTLVEYVAVFEGKFFLKSVPEGDYRLKISCLGFEDEQQVLKLNGNTILNIQLKERATVLNEVEVIAAKPIMTNENGNLTINVENAVFSSIPDPIDLLSKFPNVQVTPDRESITVIGKGIPLIYIGNQRITLEQFTALSVDDIGSIEILRNPSAKYEAEGRAVLLITPKNKDIEGIHLSLSETKSFKQNYNNYLGLNGSLKKKKLTLKANFAYNDLGTWESHRFKFEIPEADILSDYFVLIDPNDRVQINTGGGLSYQINEDDYFSANATIRLQTDDFIIDTDTFLRQGMQEDNIVTKTDNDNTKDFVSGNFNYSKKLNTGMDLFTGIQYSSFVQRLNTNISNNFNTTEFIRSQDRQQKYRIDVLAYRLDMGKTFKNNLKLEMGTNISDARANALSDIQFFESGTNVNVDYDYTEKVYAGYAQFSGNLTEKINFNVGLRIENNRVKGEIETDDIPLVDRENTNLFPKAMFNFKIGSTKSLTFNYSKSIGRPDYSRASSISSFINPFLEGTGNVNLRPTSTEEVSANFQIKNSSLSINYLRRKKPMFFTIGFEDNANNAVLSLRNLEKESGIDIVLTVPVTKKIWTSTNTATLSTRRTKDITAVVTSTRPYLYFYTNHQFKLRQNTTVSFGGWALTKRSEGIFARNAIVVLNAAITKTFFGRLHCALRFNDITKAMNFEERYTINGVDADGVYFADAREIALSMKYTFGKSKDFNYKNRDVDENLKRIK